MQLPLYLAVAATCMASVAIAHPGEYHDDALVKRKLHIQEAQAAHGNRALAKCARSQDYRSFRARKLEAFARNVASATVCLSFLFISALLLLLLDMK